MGSFFKAAGISLQDYEAENLYHTTVIGNK